MASPYVRLVSKQPALALERGIAVFSDADLSTPHTNTFTANNAGSFVNTGPARFNLRITPATGFFNGTFVHPASGKTVAYRGAVLQNRNCGYGYSLSSARLGGLAYIGPAP